VTLCDTGRPEVFLSGTEPSHTCGNGETPPPVTEAAKTAAAAAKKAETVPKAAIAAPAAPAMPSTPKDAIGDGTTFESLERKPQAQPTP
jgi:hypothetical protein